MVQLGGSQQRGSQESFYLMDGHSGVRILTDKLANITDTSSYDAFGKAIDNTSDGFDLSLGAFTGFSILAREVQHNA